MSFVTCHLQRWTMQQIKLQRQLLCNQDAWPATSLSRDSDLTVLLGCVVTRIIHGTTAYISQSFTWVLLSIFL